MKRNHTTKRVSKGGIPPYTRYKKRPYQYSANHAEWRREAMAGQVKGNIVMTKPRTMTPYLATGIAEGFEEPISAEEAREAWQYLVDTGLAYKLQGWFGREAQRLIADGFINEPSKRMRQ